MNVLPIMLVFLSLLATLSFSFLTHTKEVHNLKKTAVASIKTQRLYYSKIQQSSYKSAPRKPRQVGSFDHVTTIKPIDRPSKFPKMNLCYFTSEPQKNEKLDLFQTLLHHFYGSHPTFLSLQNSDKRKKFSLVLLNKLGSLNPKKDNLLDHFVFEDPEDGALFYKMYHGTHLYSLAENEEGYPPFFEIFKMDLSSKNTLIPFGQIPKTALPLFFSPTITALILKKEESLAKDSQRRYIPLSKEELTVEILEKLPTERHIQRLLEPFDFSREIKNNSLIKIVEPSTGMTLEKGISSYCQG